MMESVSIHELAGIGLFTMRERVALVEGELHVTSRVGCGITVLATVPLRNTNSRLPTETPNE
ncbi:MAG: hypothetical protein M3Y05_09005 [Gemmatimonadota bacterium]|nr:hypothetical protein [Gemmatimonadota bacterium]